MDGHFPINSRNLRVSLKSQDAPEVLTNRTRTGPEFLISGDSLTSHYTTKPISTTVFHIDHLYWYWLVNYFIKSLCNLLSPLEIVLVIPVVHFVFDTLSEKR